MTVAIVIPFRDRGVDWRRRANLQRALEWWEAAGRLAVVVDDGLVGSASFNRSACYNRAIEALDADVFCFTEIDLLTPIAQIDQGIEMARETPGLVVPFSRFMAMEERESALVRQHAIRPHEAFAQQVRGDCESTGAVNIVSRESLELVGGYDESFSGAWFDDSAMQIAFEVCCGPTRFVHGDAYHMYHLPGVGDHVADEEKAATERNRLRYELYKRAKTPEDIRALTRGTVAHGRG